MLVLTASNILELGLDQMIPNLSRDYRIKLIGNSIRPLLSRCQFTCIQCVRACRYSGFDKSNQ